MSIVSNIKNFFTIRVLRTTGKVLLPGIAAILIARGADPEDTNTFLNSGLEVLLGIASGLLGSGLIVKDEIEVVKAKRIE